MNEVPPCSLTFSLFLILPDGLATAKYERRLEIQ